MRCALRIEIECAACSRAHTSRSQPFPVHLFWQMSFAQVNKEAWDILSATTRYTALKTMSENCDIVHDEGKREWELNHYGAHVHFPGYYGAHLHFPGYYGGPRTFSPMIGGKATSPRSISPIPHMPSPEQRNSSREQSALGVR